MVFGIQMHINDKVLKVIFVLYFFSSETVPKKASHTVAGLVYGHGIGIEQVG
jgi:hypothetical protein